MKQHPLSSSVTARTVALLLLVLAICIEFWFLRSYTLSPVWICLANAGFLTISWSVIGLLNWGLLNRLQVWQAKIIWILFSQSVILSVWYLLFSLTYLLEQEELMRQFPFHLAAGVLCFIILFQWYEKYLSSQEISSDLQEVPDKREAEEEATGNVEDLIQHISVKNGTRIHVIPVEEIHYIEACGDYVTLFTQSGQYVKEQTMKYFETHLPKDMFVRIHRSYILHIQQISRIELFGKENYQIRLKNGNSIRASSNGYKLLKQKLRL